MRSRSAGSARKRIVASGSRWALAVALLGSLPSQATEEKPLVLFVAGAASHGYGTHEFNAGGALLVAALNAPTSPVRARLIRDGWPDAGLDLEGAAALVLYMDGGAAHPALPRLDQIERFAAAGGGLMLMHYALEVPVGDASESLLRLIGGYYEDGHSTNPVWRAEGALNAAHPITRGVGALVAPDEWYFSLRFRPGLRGVTPVLSAVPDDEARANPTWPPFAKEHVLAASGSVETLAWAVEREDGGRGVGFAGGHFHWNWGNTAYRRLVLNAIAWSTGVEIPAGGIASPDPTLERLEIGQDERRPWLCHDADEVRTRFGLD